MNVSVLAPYAKTVAAICAAIITITGVIADGNLSSDDMIVIVGAIGSVIGVYSVKNIP